MRATMISRLRSLKTTYREYLRSDHWADVKREYRASGLPQECLGCNDPKVEYHHRSYQRMGAELMTDLLPLCRKCHRAVHAYEKVSKLTPKDTHKILRLIHGWTKQQTLDRFAPYQLKDRDYPYATTPRVYIPTRPPGLRSPLRSPQ